MVLVDNCNTVRKPVQ